MDGAAPVLGRSDPRLLRSSNAPVLGHSATPPSAFERSDAPSALGVFCFGSACMNAHCLPVCLIVCMLSSMIAGVRACVHECDHPSNVHLFDRVLDYFIFIFIVCLAIFRFLMRSTSPVLGPTTPHCSRSSTLGGALLSGVRPTPAFGRSVCSALGHSGTRIFADTGHRSASHSSARPLQCSSRVLRSPTLRRSVAPTLDLDA